MEEAIDALAVMAFIGVVILLFGVSAILRIVRDLQSSELLRRDSHPDVRRVQEFATGGSHTWTCVLVVSARCPACQARAGHFSQRGSPPTLNRILLAPHDSCRSWAHDGSAVVIDPVLMGKVGVTATPTLVVYDAAGLEQWRRIVGSDDELDLLLRRALYEQRNAESPREAPLRSPGDVR